MYGLVEELDRESVKRIAIQAFREMRRCGMTTVGEFHYLHHDCTDDEIIHWCVPDAIVCVLEHSLSNAPKVAMYP